jgi:hypothetical protein
VESAIENAKKALIHDHLGRGIERSVESTGHTQARQADREREVLDVAISSEEEDSRVFMRFAKDLGFDLDAIHFLYRPEYRDRTTTVSETTPFAVLGENGPSRGVSPGRFSPLRLGAASRLILVAVGCLRLLPRRDMGALRQSSAEGNVLARQLIEQNSKIVRRDPGCFDYRSVSGRVSRIPLDDFPDLRSSRRVDR